MRIVSLLPAATEIVGALGLLDQLVGISHECDYPPAVSALPRVTHCPIHNAGLSSAEVDAWVRSSLAEHGTLYHLDEALLRALKPDLILTQKLCDVCAVGYGSVARLAAQLPGPPLVLNLEPLHLSDVWNDITRIAEVCSVPERGRKVTAAMRQRVVSLSQRWQNAGVTPRRCVLLEWADPPFCAGHWMPEVVALAGGHDPLGRSGQPSARIAWDRVVAAQPQVLLLSLCGYTAQRAREDLPLLQEQPGWESLPAVQEGRVFLLDANAYYSRPGPRLVDALEMTAGALHPALFPEFQPTCFGDERILAVQTPSLVTQVTS